MAEDETRSEDQPESGVNETTPESAAPDDASPDGADSAPTSQPSGEAKPDPASDAAAEAPAKNAAEQLADEAMAAVREAVTELETETGGGGQNGNPTPFTPEQLTQFADGGAGGGIDMLGDVNLNVKIELGRTRMLVEDVLKLSDGAVVELDKLAGDPVDIYVNDRHIARGEVLILNDNFCVRVSEILDATIEDG